MIIIKGEVKKGRGIGKTLGFPTINIETTHIKEKDFGVYAAQAHINGLIYKAAVHIGIKPTINENTPICEAYLLDWESGDLYNTEVKIITIQKIRDIKKFKNLTDLKVQIVKDVELTRNILS